MVISVCLKVAAFRVRVYFARPTDAISPKLQTTVERGCYGHPKGTCRSVRIISGERGLSATHVLSIRKEDIFMATLKTFFFSFSFVNF